MLGGHAGRVPGLGCTSVINMNFLAIRVIRAYHIARPTTAIALETGSIASRYVI